MDPERSKLIAFREACRQDEGWIVGNRVAIRASGTATSEGQFTALIHKDGALIAEAESMRGGNAPVTQASGDHALHPWLAGPVIHFWNYATRSIAHENFATQIAWHSGTRDIPESVTVIPRKIGGISIIDLGHLHYVGHGATAITRDPERPNARRNSIYVRRGSWEGSELGSRVSFHLDLSGPVRSWISQSPLGRFLGPGAPFCWQKITGDGLAIVTAPGRRVNQRVLGPDEKYEFMDIRQLFGMSAGMHYKAHFNPVRSAWQRRPWIPITFTGPGLLLEHQ